MPESQARPESHAVISDRTRKQIRIGGLLLLLAGSSVAKAASVAAHSRALVMEQQAEIERSISGPGSLLWTAGVALLEMSSNLR